MKQLLRSVIDFNGSITPENLALNIKRLSAAVATGLTWLRPDDQTIYEYIESYLRTHGEVPSVDTIAHAHQDDIEITERLQDIATCAPFYRTNYKYLLDDTIAEARRVKLAAILTQAKTIALTGLESGKGKDKIVRKGVDASLRYLQEEITRYAQTAQSTIPTISAADIFEPLPPPKWLCEGLRLSPQVGVVMIAGYGDSAKTLLAMHIALCVASGLPVFGIHAVTQGRVLHLDFEQGQYLTCERYQREARGMGIDVQRLIAEDRLRLAVFPSQKIDDPETEDLLKAMLKDVDLVIIDSFRAASPSTDENSSEARVPLDMLSRVCEGRTLPLVIHHARKPSKEQEGGDLMSIRGSSALFDALGGCFVAKRTNETCITLTHRKERLRGIKLAPITYRVVDVPKDDDPRWGLHIEVVPDEQTQTGENPDHCAMVLRIIVENPGVNLRTLRSRAKGLGHAALDHVLLHLEDTRHIETKPGKRGAVEHHALRERYHEPTGGMEACDAMTALDFDLREAV